MPEQMHEVHRVYCDSCYRFYYVMAQSKRELREVYEAAGWFRKGKKVFCEVCKKTDKSFNDRGHYVLK